MNALLTTAPPPQKLVPHRAGCACGVEVTDSHLKLMTLYGALQELEWLTVEAQHAVSGPSPMGNPALHDSLLKLQLELTRAQGVCLKHAFPLLGRPG